MANLPETGLQKAISKSTKARVLESGFGDGYRQRAGDGINVIEDEWSLEWVLESTGANTLTGFLETHGGYTSFDWTPKGESSAKKWTCDSWDKIPLITDELWRITASIKQEFDLD